MRSLSQIIKMNEKESARREKTAITLPRFQIDWNGEDLIIEVFDNYGVKSDGVIVQDKEEVFPFVGRLLKKQFSQFHEKEFKWKEMKKKTKK